MTIHDVRRRAAGTLLEALGRWRGGKRASGRLPQAGVHRILVCRVTHTLGNTLLLTPLIRELEAVYPGAQVDVLTRSPVADAIFGGFFSVQRIAVLPAHGLAHPFAFRMTLRELFAQPYDLVIDPCPRSATGRILAMMARGTFKLGFESAWKRGGLTHAAPASTMPGRTGQQPVHLLREALGARQSMRFPTPDIALTAGERRAGRDALARIVGGDPGGGVIGVFANATGAKYLGDAWWQRFMPALEAQLPAARIVEIVPATAKSLLGDRYPAYFGSDIRKLASVLAALDGFVSADCGVMHLACASGVPVTAIFSKTDPDEWGPYGARDRILWAHDVPPEDIARQVRLTETRPAGRAVERQL